MSFRRLQQRVVRAETHVQQHLAASNQQWKGLVHTWHKALTPSRVVVAGVVAGFVVGQFKTGQTLKSVLDSPRWLRALVTLAQAGQETIASFSQLIANAAKNTQNTQATEDKTPS